MKFATALGLVSAGVVQAAHMPDLDVWCADAVATCPAAYTDLADCKAKAALFPVGFSPNVGAAKAYAGTAAHMNPGTDTFYCRDYHLGVAKGDTTNPSTHCGHIGGAGEIAQAPCAKNECQAFCDDYVATCMGADMKYTDAAECKTKCDGWLTGNKRSFYGATSNSFGCRRYHLDVAMGADAGAAATHCPHAGADGGAVCVDSPASFCELFGVACNTDTSYGTTCEADFGAIPEGEPTDTKGNTQHCRQYHLDVAFNVGEPEVHCPHAAKTGGGVCAEPEPEPEPEPTGTASRSFAGAAAAVTLAVALFV